MTQLLVKTKDGKTWPVESPYDIKGDEVEIQVVEKSGNGVEVESPASGAELIGMVAAEIDRLLASGPSHPPVTGRSTEEQSDSGSEENENADTTCEKETI